MPSCVCARPSAVGEESLLIPAGPSSPNLLCSVLPGVCLEPETGTKTRESSLVTALCRRSIPSYMCAFVI